MSAAETNVAAPSPTAMPVKDQSGVAGATTTGGDGNLLQLVSFMVGDEEFAIPILSVQEINRMMQITRVPQSPDFVEGVINLRGKIIPVMDLRKRFGQSAVNNSADARIIVVEVESGGGRTRVIGFTVDRVNEVLRISESIVEPPPTMVTSSGATPSGRGGGDYVQGVGKLDDRLLILLNLQKLFGGREFAAAENLAA